VSDKWAGWARRRADTLAGHSGGVVGGTKKAEVAGVAGTLRAVVGAVSPGTEVYEGMTVGENFRADDVNVNLTRERRRRRAIARARGCAPVRVDLHIDTAHAQPTCPGGHLVWSMATLVDGR
jgi:hypothetical protein